MDGIAIFLDTIQDMEQSRRDLYKTVLPAGWKGILAKPEESHNELFGYIEAHQKDCQAHHATKTGGGGKGKGDKEVGRETCWVKVETP